MITKLTVLWTPFALLGGSTPATVGSHLTKLTALWPPFAMTITVGPGPEPTGNDGDIGKDTFVWMSIMGSSTSTLS